jgi:hypothetical protein
MSNRSGWILTLACVLLSSTAREVVSEAPDDHQPASRRDGLGTIGRDLWQLQLRKSPTHAPGRKWVGRTSRFVT